MVLADHVYRDAATGKYIIAGTFGVIWQGEQKLAPQPAAGSEIVGDRQTFAGPITRAGSPYLYVALSEVHDRAQLKLRYVDLATSNVLIEGQVEVTSTDPISVVEFGFPLPMLPITPGSFSLDLLYEGEILGSWRVTVKQKPSDSPEHK